MKKLIPAILIILLSCSQFKEDSEMNKISANTKLTKEDMVTIASKKIYFGHQSVGFNIIEGLTAVLPSDSGIKIIETTDQIDFKKPVFAHFKNGENRKPETKIRHFETVMQNSIGKHVDIAFFKFCYIDITAQTDVESLFEKYQKSFNLLSKAYPDVLFIHITTPLTTEEQGFKTKLKSIIKSLTGKQTGHEYDNIQRMRFNEKLLSAYGDKVFDLARIESTKPDGTVVKSTRGGVSHYSLLQEYTYDGGHLNQDGSKLIAGYFIHFLANLK